MSASKRKDYVNPEAIAKLTLVTVLAGDTVTINGLVYIGVAGIKSDNTEFSVDTSDTAAATDLINSINNDVRTPTVTGVTLVATSTAGVITIVATGTNAHTLDLVSSNTTISYSSFALSGLSSNVADNNKTLKQVNVMNTPYSVQSSGADKIDGRLKSVTTEAEFNTILANSRVLNGSREGFVKSIVASTSLVFTFFDKIKEEEDTTLTMAEVIASNNLFFLDELQ